MTRKVLIFSPYGRWTVHGQMDAVVGAALATRGAEVLAVTCNALYKTCAMDRGTYDCARCFKTSTGLFASLGVRQAPLNGWISPDESARVDDEVAALSPDELANLSRIELSGQPMGDWVLSNLFTHHRISTQHLGEAHVQDTARGFLKGAYLTHIGISNLLKEFPADAALLFSGRFYPHRTAFQTLKAQGVSVATHERGHAPNTFSVRDNLTVLAREDKILIHQLWRDVPLTKLEVAEQMALLRAKRQGKNTGIASFYGPRQTNRRVLEMLNLPPERKIIGVFTSSQDEISSIAGYEASHSQGDLLESLYQYYHDKPVSVIVRHHPHVAGWFHGHRDNAFLDALRAAEAKVPANFRIVAADDKAISSYDLFPLLSAAYAPFSSISNELLTCAVPTVVHRSMEGVAAGQAELDGFDPASIARAARALEDFGPILDRDELRKALRCAYSFYFRGSLALKSIGIKDLYKPDIRVKSPADLQPGVDPDLDRICDTLMGLRTIYARPGADPTPQSFAEEDEALDDIRRDAIVRRGQTVPARDLKVEPRARSEKTATLRAFLNAGPSIPFDDTLLLINGARFAAKVGEPISADEPVPEAARLVFYGDHARSVDDLATSVAFHRALLRLRRANGRYVMILGNGDYLLDKTIAALLPPNLHRLWGNNLADRDESLRYFPMGRDPRTIADINAAAQSPHKDVLCYVDYALNTHPVRPRIFEAIKEKDFMLFGHMGNAPQHAAGNADIMSRLAGSKFAVCPRGTTIETFQMWDALSAGTIPIVVKEAAFHDELTDLPILFLDDAADYGQLTAPFLEETYQRFLDTPFNFEKLRLSYWLDRLYDDCIAMEAA